ncbi:MAG: PKD domain-containing protein [Bacteroidales bacterium]
MACNVVINPSPALPICNEATLTANASGGTGPYTYLWSTAATTQSILVTVSGTYSVTITDALLCTANKSFVATVYSAPTPAITGSNVFCPNFPGAGYSTPLVAGNTYLWTVAGGTFVGSPTNNTVTVNWGGAGNATLSVKETTTLTGCNTTVTLPILINPLPTPFVSGLQCVCVNSVGVTYSTPAHLGSTYVWSLTGGTIFAGAGTNQIIVNWEAIPQIGLVTVNETSAAGCVNSSTLNVTITAYPVASVTVGNNNACSGTPVNFQGPAGAGYTYLWNFNDPPSGTNNTSILQNPSHVFNTYGCGTTTYNVTLTVTNLCGCSTTSLPQAVTIKQQPNPQLADQDPISPFSNCDNNPSPAIHDFPITLNNATPNAGCISGYTIDWGDGTPISPYAAGFTTATHLYTNLGAFNLVFTATGTNGCSNSITYTVANQSVPAVGISNNGGNTAGCYPITFTFTIDGAANNSPGTIYEISYGDGTMETKTNEELLVNNIVSHTYTSSSCGQGIPGNQYTVRVIASNACLISVEATVNQIKVYKPPVASFSTSPSSNGCVNTSVCVTNTSTPGYGFNCNQVTTWLWNFGDPGAGASNTSTLQTPPCHIYSTPGTYTITLTASNDQCQSGSVVTHTICINPSPISSFAVNNDNGCKPLTVNATNTSTTANTCGDLVYTWSVVFNGAGTCTPSTGLWSFTGGSNLHSQHASFIFNDQGTYTITLAVQNSCTTVLSTKTVTVKTVPKVTVANLASICAQGTVNPTATYELCYASGTTFQWLFPGGSPAGSTSLIPGAVAYNNANTYTLTLNATNECGIGTGSATLLVKPVPVIPAQTVTICSGGLFTITPANAPPVTIVPAGTTYNWSAPAGTGFTGGTSGTSQNSITGTLTNTTNTIQTATYTVTPVSAACVGASFTVIVTIYPLPAPYNITGGGEYCSGGAGVFVGLSDSEIGVNYQMFINGVPSGAIVVGTGLPITFGNRTAAGIYTIIATNTTTSCTNYMTGNVAIVINPLPTTNAGADQIIPFGTSLTLAGIAAGGTAPLSYSWTPAGSIASGGTTLNPQTTNLYTSTTFTMLVTDSKGCMASDSKVVILNGNPLSVNSSATPATICSNGALVQLNAVATGGSGTYAYSWVSDPVGSPVWTSTLPNPVVNPTVTTTYTVTVNDGYNTASTQVTVTVNPSPLVYVITGGGEFCSGGSGVQIGLSGAQMGVSYQLFMNGMPVGTPLVGTGGPIVFGIFTSGGTYTAVATNIVTTCSSMMAGNAIIVVNPLPVANAGFDQSIPFGTSSTLSGTVSGGTIPYSYAWSPVTNLASGFNTLMPTTTNLYSSVMFTLSVTDSKGCSSNDNVLVSVGGEPLSVSCNATPNMICNGTTAQLSANPTGGSESYTYAWASNPAGWNSTLQNPTVSPNNSTTYTVTVNDGFTTAACNIQVTVKPVPQITNSPLSKTICSGTSTSISLFSTVPGTSYQWTSSVITGSVTGNSASGIGTGFIGDILVNTGMVTGSVNYLIMPVANGCFGTPVNYIVAVQPLPLIGTSPASQTICSGTSSQPITISSSLAGTTYSWSTISSSGISGALLTGTSNPVPGWVLNNSAATAGTVAINIVPTAQGCTGQSLDYLINVNLLPVPSIAGPTNVCAGSSGQLYSTESGMTGYTWSVSPGGTITSGSGSNQVAITWQSAGNQTVNVLYTNANGCHAISPSTLAVTVNGIPAAAGTISGLPAVCVNAIGVPYSIAPLQNALTYNWTLPLGASMASGSGTSSITVNFPNFVTTGNVRVAGVNNCFTGAYSPNLQVKTNAQLTGQVSLNNMTIMNGQEECLAVQSIILGGEATFTVQAGGQVRLIAGNNILFLNGTTINPGGYLSALITQQCIPCNMLKSNDLTRVSTESDGHNETLNTPQDNPCFMIYPNPTDGIFTIASKNRIMGNIVVLQIFDVMGKMKVEEKLEPFTKREFSISEFPAGIYHLRLIVDDNTQVIRMIKAK